VPSDAPLMYVSSSSYDMHASSSSPGVCLVIHHATSEISVCHSQALADFIQNQRQEAASASPATASSSTAPPSAGWERILGLGGGAGGGSRNGKARESSMEGDKGEVGGAVVVDGLQCRALADGLGLLVYLVGGSQLAVLHFTPGICPPPHMTCMYPPPHMTLYSTSPQAPQPSTSYRSLHTAP
jgi:hypothetical protein